MAQVPSIPDPPSQDQDLLNLSQALRQRLSVNQHTEPPVLSRIHRKPVPIQETMPQLQSSNPFQSASQQKPHAVPVERPFNPFCSAGRTQVNSSDSTIEDGAPVFIGVVGITGSGKSSLINRVTGCDDVVVSDHLRSGNGFGIPFKSRLTSMIRN